MIDYQNDLNPAQYEAATTLEGPVLVIAGAGSGKTRTIVYRLARLVESGVPASSILLLTFTRKAAQEMLDRAKRLLYEDALSGEISNDLATNPHAAGKSHDHSSLSLELAAVQGGTFHSFAFSILRLFQPAGYGNRLTVMDSHDMTSALHHCREELKAGKGDRSFPKNQTILALISKSRNKEQPLQDILTREAHHLLPHCDTLEALASAYALFKREKNLLDYDDLLFALEEVLRTKQEALAYCRRKFRYIMVDEYQDTNPVQARIAALVAGGSNVAAMPEDEGLAPGNIMVVGDDAQSIYAFRGADVRNILRFPEIFNGTKIIRLEENYRSTQPILDLTNGLLKNATEGYAKHLFTLREGGIKPSVIRPFSDRTEANLVVSRIVELLNQYPAQEIAVLFRAGYHSYHTEIQLNKLGIKFRKYGGIRYAEAAHIKDVMAFIRLVQNPLDFTAFARIASLASGVGPKTCLKIYQLATQGDRAKLEKTLVKYADLAADIKLIDTLRSVEHSPASLLAQVNEHYKAKLVAHYPDDHPRRQQGLDQLLLIAGAYRDLDLFIADLSLDDPLQEEEERNTIVLSTIHSAKGLEWSAVLVIDLVEERFPARQSMTRSEDFEEERRLMYVACTRARERLELFVPSTVFDRSSGGSIPAVPSPFIRELSSSLFSEWQEGYTGAITERKQRTENTAAAVIKNLRRKLTPTEDSADDREGARADRLDESDLPTPVPLPDAPVARPEQCGYCHHKIFGRGKIVQHIPPDKYRVNFPGFGLKVIMSAYLRLEE